MTDTAKFRPVAITLYVLAVLLFFSPVMELFIGVWPPRPGDIQWRFGLLGLVATSVLTPLVALVFVFTAATALDHGRVVKALGVVSALGALFMLLAMGAFLLDMVQLRTSVVASQQRAYVLASGKALFTFVLAAGVLTTVAVFALRRRRSSARAEPAPLIK